MKKLVFALVMVLLMALAACAGGTTPTTDAPVDTSEVTAPEVPAEEITVTEEPAAEEPAAEEPAAEEPAAEEPAAEEPATTDETAATGAGVSLTGVEVSPPINAGDTIQAVDADASPAATPDLSGGPYWLQTMFLEGENKCLDGNQVADDAPLGGAAYMNDCSDAAGMLWTIVPDAEAGYYSPVSYTHLDVYKRQGSRPLRCSTRGWPSSASWATAMSRPTPTTIYIGYTPNWARPGQA